MSKDATSQLPFVRPIFFFQQTKVSPHQPPFDRKFLQQGLLKIFIQRESVQICNISPPITQQDPPALALAILCKHLKLSLHLRLHHIGKRLDFDHHAPAILELQQDIRGISDCPFPKVHGKAERLFAKCMHQALFIQQTIKFIFQFRLIKQQPTQLGTETLTSSRPFLATHSMLPPLRRKPLQIVCRIKDRHLRPDNLLEHLRQLIFTYQGSE